MTRPASVSLVKCAFILIVSGIFVGVVTGWFSPASRAQAKPDGVPAQTPAPAAPAEKPVEEVYKNIQVLKGMPASQLMMAMNFMRASLGTNCAFCHVQNGQDWDFAKDEKRPKATARKMIQMVMGVNKETFNGQTRVSCFTCHRGSEHTNGLPPLPQIAPEGGPGGVAEKPASAETLPTADQLFDKFVQAVGGQAALAKAKTRVAKGTQTTTDGRSLSIDLSQAPPNKILLTATGPQGAQARGYDGAKGWTRGPRGNVTELNGDGLSQLLRWADFNWPLTLKSRFTATRVTGKEKIGDREAYVLFGQLADGKRERLYFDTQTGLLLRDVVSEVSLVGNIPSQIDYEDYRDVGGVKLPFTVRLSLVDPWSSWTRKYSEIKADAPVDEKSFAMPAVTTLPPKP